MEARVESRDCEEIAEGTASDEEVEESASDEEEAIVVEGPPDSEREINHLVDLRSNSKDIDDETREKLVAQEALREWTESVKVLEGKVSRRTKRKDGLRNEIYQLVGLYSVFVGVVFSAVQSDRVQCRHIWSPVFLSLLTCFIIIYAIKKKFADIKQISSDIAEDDRDRKVLLPRIKNLKLLGHKKFKFSVHAKVREPITKEIDQESKTGLVVILIIILSTLVLVASFVHILCLTRSPSCEDCVNWHDYAPGRILPY